MTYTVTVTREDDLWVAQATAADGSTVGVLDFDDFADLHVTMPEFIADMTDPDDLAPVTWRYEINGQDITAVIRQLMVLEDQLRHAQEERSRARSQALAALTGAGLSQRVMADVLHVSPQRVNQLVKAAA